LLITKEQAQLLKRGWACSFSCCDQKMSQGMNRFKPAASRKTHLWLSALLWTVIGSMLLAKGAYRFSHLPHGQPVVVIAAFILGSLKSIMVLDKAAKRTINRILSKKDGSCLGGVYSIKTWLLVVGMMLLGLVLRNSSLPVSLLCFIYFTIGWAMLLSSRLGWQAWRREKSLVRA
jgi:hypothetical protein